MDEEKPPLLIVAEPRKPAQNDRHIITETQPSDLHRTREIDLPILVSTLELIIDSIETDTRIMD